MLWRETGTYDLMKSPIFIIGNPRSGTTLLRLMLTCHRDIVIPPECGFAVWWYEKYRKWNSDYTDQHMEEFLRDLFTSKKIETWNLNKGLLKEFLLRKKTSIYSELVSSVYEFYAGTQKKDFKRWGDKNNYYLNHVDVIFNLFPGVQFIHIIRDGRDIACSYKDVANSTYNSPYAPQLPAGAYEIAKEWVTNIKRIRESFNAVGWDKVIEIRYEDLVSFPEQTLEKICSFLNEDFDMAMLDFHLLNKEQELEPRDFLEWKSKTLHRVTTSQAGRYKRCLTDDEIKIINGAAAEIFEIYNYQ